jgi:hypothetical protein
MAGLCQQTGFGKLVTYTARSHGLGRQCHCQTLAAADRD